MPEYRDIKILYQLIQEQIDDLKITGNFSKGMLKAFNVVKSILNDEEQLPTADVQRVVRCKDCVAYDSLTGRFKMNVCHRNNKIFPKNGYCSYGIKKDCGAKMDGKD